MEEEIRGIIILIGHDSPDLGPVRWERKAGQPFRFGTVSHVKMVVLPV